MQVQLTERYCEIGETSSEEHCVYCGGVTFTENPVLLFSALGRPSVAVHRRCYIHWAFLQPELNENLT
jgi:hypothetical protein